MSPDGKKLATTNIRGETRLIQCHDLTIQKYVANLQQGSDEVLGISPAVAFDPTSRLYAVACIDGSVELRTL
jgi:hypothetical protein